MTPLEKVIKTAFDMISSYILTSLPRRPNHNLTATSFQVAKPLRFLFRHLFRRKLGLGVILGGLRVVLGDLGAILGGLGVVFGGSWRILGRSWAGLGRSWGVLVSPSPPAAS